MYTSIFSSFLPKGAYNQDETKYEEKKTVSQQPNKYYFGFYLLFRNNTIKTCKPIESSLRVKETLRNKIH